MLLVILNETYDAFNGGIMKKSKATFCLMLFVFLLLSVISGFIVSHISERNVVENYFRDIIIAEDFVIENQELTEIYGDGKPFTISSGMHGRIEDSIAASGGDTKGYEYINAYIYDVNGSSLNVAISIDPDVDNDVMVVESEPDLIMSESNLDNTKIRIVYPVIGISKIDSYEEILLEYKQSREIFNSRIKVARMSGVATGIGMSIILCGGFVLLLRKTWMKHQDE